MDQTIIKRYSELISLPTFEERYNYLRVQGRVGAETFGSDRYLNQRFYKSDEWIELRDFIIDRDNGCDLGIAGRDIYGLIIIHHIMPISKYDIINRTRLLLDPENLICVSDNTHKAIHYGDDMLLIKDPVIRTPFDTCPWRH